METAAVPQPQTIQISIDGPQKQSGLPMVIWVSAAIIIGIVLYYVYAAIRRYHRQITIRNNCRGGGETYLVMIYSFRDPAATAATIMDLFEHAYCPMRINIAVYQDMDKYDVDTYSIVSDYVEQSDVLKSVVNTNLRIITSDNATRSSHGALFAYNQLLTRASDGEKWACIMRPGASPCVHWDRVLINQHARVNDRSAALTVLPGREHRASISSDINRTDVQGWIRSLTHSAQRASRNVRDSSIATFPVIKEFNGRIPVLEARSFPQLPVEPVECSMVSSGMVFLHTSLLKHAFEHSSIVDEPCAEYAVDYALSMMLFNMGAKFYTPDVLNVLIEKRSDKPIHFRPTQWDSKAFTRQLIQEDAENYAAFVGVDMKERVVSGRARMGMCPTVSELEIVQKYATHAEFNRVMQSLA